MASRRSQTLMRANVREQHGEADGAQQGGLSGHVRTGEEQQWCSRGEVDGVGDDALQLGMKQIVRHEAPLVWLLHQREGEPGPPGKRGE